MPLNNEEISKINSLYNEIDKKDVEISSLKEQVDIFKNLSSQIEVMQQRIFEKLDDMVAKSKAKTTK